MNGCVVHDDALVLAASSSLKLCRVQNARTSDMFGREISERDSKCPCAYLLQPTVRDHLEAWYVTGVSASWRSGVTYQRREPKRWPLPQTLFISSCISASSVISDRSVITRGCVLMFWELFFISLGWRKRIEDCLEECLITSWACSTTCHDPFCRTCSS